MKTTAEDPITTSYQEKQARLSELRKSRQGVTDQSTEVSDSINSLTERIRKMRVQELVEGSTQNAESLEMLQMSLEDKRAELLKLQEEQGYIASAEAQLEVEISKLGFQVKAQAAERFKARYVAEAETVKGLANQLMVANERLVDLDADLRKSGLAEFGGKSLILIARSGLNWNAVAPLPIVGSATHVSDWLAHVNRLLGE